MTRKAPTGRTHAGCLDHVQHDYLKSGWLCITTNVENIAWPLGRDMQPVDRAADMRAFADHLVDVAARHRTAEIARPAAGGPIDYETPVDFMPDGRPILPAVCRGSDKYGCTIGSSSSIHLHNMGGSVHLPIDTAADRAARSRMGAELDARKRRTVKVAPAAAPVVKVRPAPAAPAVKPRRAMNVNIQTRQMARQAAGAAPAPEPAAEPIVDAPALSPSLRASRRSGGISTRKIRRSAVWTPRFETRAEEREALEDLDAPEPDDAPEPIVTPAEPWDSEAHDALTDGEYAIARAAYVAPAVVVIETAPVILADPAPVLSIVPAPSGRPTCPRCGQSFRVSGVGRDWHVLNNLGCAATAARRSA